MNLYAMRDFVKSLYPGKWGKRVDCMQDNQVMAIYFKHVNSIKKPKTEEPKEYQITIWDIMNQNR